MDSKKQSRMKSSSPKNLSEQRRVLNTRLHQWLKICGQRLIDGERQTERPAKKMRWRTRLFVENTEKFKRKEGERERVNE